MPPMTRQRHDSAHRLFQVLGPLAAAGLAAAPIAALAQPGDRPSRTGPSGDGSTGGPTTQTVPALPPRIIVVPVEAPTLQPVRPNVPPTPVSDLDLAGMPPLMREGAFISTARAQVVQGKSGRWYAIFDPDAAGRTLPPMILMESPHLSAIERSAERASPGTRMRLTGRVAVYRERNFLLPTAPPIVERGPDPARPAEAPAAVPRPVDAPDGPKPAPDGGSDPSVERIIADLDKVAGPRRPIAAPPPAPERPQGSSGDPTPSAERSAFLAGRRARVVRGAGGAPMAVVDAGAAGRTEGPFVLLPCQNLAAIEAYVDAQGDAASFTLTGEVHEYGGRRYLLPTMFVVTKAQQLVMPTQ